MKARRVAQALAGAILATTVIASAAAPATAAKGGAEKGHGSVVVPTDTGWGII